MEGGRKGSGLNPFLLVAESSSLGARLTLEPGPERGQAALTPGCVSASRPRRALGRAVKCQVSGSEVRSDLAKTTLTIVPGNGLPQMLAKTVA